MAIEKHVADAFRLDEEGWARHANPWSAWSRFATGIPMPIVAIWSREWIGLAVAQSAPFPTSR